MAPKRRAPRKRAPKKKSRTGHADTSDQPAASDPNPTITSPSTSVATGRTATASLLPSSALPSAPPTTATTTQPPPLLPPLSIQATHQEHISGTSVGATTSTHSAGPSTAPSASAASTSTPPLLLLTAEEFMFRFLPKLISTMLAMKDLREMGPDVTASQPRPMHPAPRTLLEVAEKETKAAKDFVADLTVLKEALEELERQLDEKTMR